MSKSTPAIGWAHPLPAARPDCLLVFATRRIATLGLRDAMAALLIIELCGARFRRPLVLLRAFVLELSLAARRPIEFARCCTPAMTEDERLILSVLRNAIAGDLEAAEQALRSLTGNAHLCEALAAAAALGRAAAGSPLRCRQPRRCGSTRARPGRAPGPGPRSDPEDLPIRR